jgi:hypothetical protein
VIGVSRRWLDRHDQAVLFGIWGVGAAVALAVVVLLFVRDAREDAIKRQERLQRMQQSQIEQRRREDECWRKALADEDLTGSERETYVAGCLGYDPGNPPVYEPPDDYNWP